MSMGKSRATKTKKHPQQSDGYAWLRDANWSRVLATPSRLKKDIRCHLENENRLTDTALEKARGLSREIFTELRQRVPPQDSTVPEQKGNFAYFDRYGKFKEYPTLCRDTLLPRKSKRPTVLLQRPAIAQGKSYCRFSGWDVTADHSLLAWSMDDTGNERYDVFFKNIAPKSGAKGQAPLKDALKNTTGTVVWARDGTTLFYIAVDAYHRPSKVFAHRLGTAQKQDRLVYEEKDTGFFVTLHKSLSGDFIIISAHDHETSQCHLIPSSAPDTPPVCFTKRRKGLCVSVEHDSAGARFFILTNQDGACDYKIMVTPQEKIQQKYWRQVIPHKKGRLITDFGVFFRHMAFQTMENAQPAIHVYDYQQRKSHSIDFDEDNCSLDMLCGSMFRTKKLRVAYSSLKTPEKIIDYNMESRKSTVRKRQKISGHRPENYIVRRIMAPSFDKVGVPISLFYHKDTVLKGNNNLLLYAYGAYGINTQPYFSSTRLSLVNRGFIYAIAHVRGGREKGEQWYTQGKLHRKVNTFKDFIAAARFLIKNGLTAKKRITAHGGSAGGLLMGAVANMDGQLFRSIVAEVPFVDTLNTMLDATLPLTPPEWPEWGNPIKSKKDYNVIAAYSPYDNVTAQGYPHILATAGLTDPRVGYWEPAKWIARLKELKTDTNLTLLKTEMSAGHGGKAGRFQRLQQVAFVLAFILFVHQLDKENKK